MIPPTTGCDEPHPLLCEPGAPLRVVREAEPWPDAPLRAGVSAMGFGGINTHVVLEAADVRRTTARLATRDRRVAREPLDCEVFALSADTQADLAAVLERVAARAATMSFAEHADLAAALAERAHGDAPVRAAIVARDPAELSARAERAGELLAGLGAQGLAARPGVYVGRGAPGRVGLLFPGQGAPVRDRAGALGVVLPETGECFEGGLPEDPVDTAVAQPAVFRASTAALHWLDRLGVAAAAAVGHSLGEITALHWAGALSRRDALHLVTRRGRIMADHSEAGTGMASLAAPPGAVTELIDDADLVIAADNGAVQVVAPLTEVDRVVKRARAKGITAGRLRVSHAFHSPAVAAAEPVLARHLADLEVAGPPGRVYSTITGRELTAADDVRALLARQLTAPVRFREALELLAADCDLLVEAAPATPSRRWPSRSRTCRSARSTRAPGRRPRSATPPPRCSPSAPSPTSRRSSPSASTARSTSGGIRSSSPIPARAPRPTASTSGPAVPCRTPRPRPAPPPPRRRRRKRRRERTPTCPPWCAGSSPRRWSFLPM
ncbi:acyltransferase domain-containing protein [Actinomadura luteofluorescens]|uniref:acyltransferase domain-containing protein n=1 Tax=Actinomadura luteofluorescens TaxID=46163 RepID=UPI0036451802